MRYQSKLWARVEQRSTRHWRTARSSLGLPVVSEAIVEDGFFVQELVISRVVGVGRHDRMR
jgi:hypothetical protein